MSTTKTSILADLADEAQHIAKTTTIDLDAFLALHGEQRAARWRQMDRAGKWQLVALMIERRGCDWTDEEVERWIAAYDARWCVEPTLQERAVEAALERLAEENADHARTARRVGEREDARFFQRATNAYVKALAQYRAGVRPRMTAGGGWLLPSSRQGEPPHLLRMDGDWVCSCAAGTTMHWASALIIGIEMAGELADAEHADGGNTRRPRAGGGRAA